jgi:hypothetical protein
MKSKMNQKRPRPDESRGRSERERERERETRKWHLKEGDSMSLSFLDGNLGESGSGDVEQLYRKSNKTSNDDCQH